MSSFRPDVEPVSVDFVPASVGPHDWSVAALEEGEPNDASMDVDVESAAPAPPSPEEIAALEQAAFDRGAESVRVDRAALASTCAAMDRAVEEWRSAASTLVTANRSLVLDLCRELVRHWVQAELVTSPEQYATYLDQALQDVREDSGVRLALAADDLTRLEEHASDALDRWREAGVEIAPDPALGLGSFTLETSSAGVDGRLGTIADRLRTALAPATAAPLSDDATVADAPDTSDSEDAE